MSVSMGFYACKRDTSMISPATQATNNGNAFIRFIDLSPNFRDVNSLADSFNIYMNGTKITAFQPGTAYQMTYNSAFPASTTANGYIAVPAGAQAIKLTVAGILTPDSVAIKTLNKTLVANQYYSFLITDSLSSTRDSSQIFVQDQIQSPTIGYFNLRFVHAVLNDTVGKNIDIFSTRSNRVIFANIKPGTVTSFAQFGYNAILSDTLYVRRAGSPSIVLDTLNTVNFSSQRTYSLIYKGNGNIYNNSIAKRRHMGTYVH